MQRLVLLAQDEVMGSSLPMILAYAAQSAAAPPATAPGVGQAAPQQQESASGAVVESCKSTEPKDVKADTREIIVCAVRSEGYRIDPDVLEAERAKKHNRHPRRPERLVDRSCESVGPMGCRDGAGINLLAAAVTAVTMVERAAKGENVGEMFITDPQPDEYQLYQEAKRAREAREAEQHAALKANAKAEAPAAPPQESTAQPQEE